MYGYIELHNCQGAVVYILSFDPHKKPQGETGISYLTNKPRLRELKWLAWGHRAGHDGSKANQKHPGPFKYVSWKI